LGEFTPPTSFSLARDGKHHDAIFTVEGGVVSVIYWAPQGAVRRTAPSESAASPEETARDLLLQMIC